MIRLFVGSLGVRASPILRQRLSSVTRYTRSVSLAAPSPTNTHAGLILRDGKAVLYRGPAAMRPSLYYFIGAVFVGAGANIGYMVYNSFSWPLTFRDPENPPKLIGLGYRMVIAGLAVTFGLFTAWVFVIIPPKTITKLTLDLRARQLIMRTSAREFSALLPRILFPRPFRTTAELAGHYKTDRINERVVPLSQVFRIRGSALSAGDTRSARSLATAKAKESLFADERQFIEIQVGSERARYILESAGGADPPAKGGYKGFWRRLQHRLRGKTDWEDQKAHAGALGDSLGDKEPWFANRKTFDDVVPLIKRR